MKLTDPGIIKEGEKDLIDAIKDDLDLDSINDIIKDKLKIKNLKSKGGRIVVHNNEVAFKIEFELSLNGSLMFDREGNYIADNVGEVPETGEDNIEPSKNEISDKEDDKSNELTVEDLDDDIKEVEDIEDIEDIEEEEEEEEEEE